MKRYLLVVWDDIEPKLKGPYDDNKRFNVAVEIKEAVGDDCGLYTLDIADDCSPEVGTFCGGFALQDH